LGVIFILPLIFRGREACDLFEYSLEVVARVETASLRNGLVAQVGPFFQQLLGRFYAVMGTLPILE
jgi:hypothetical protein